jgi:glycosyltransferase involved in cell wall biosynthesis
MKKLSIIIPVYNEEKYILEILRRVNKVPLKNVKKEIIIVDDFSTDKTREILNKIKNKNIKIFYHTKNIGKGGAIRTALKHVTGDIILIQDADLEYKPEEYPKLIKPILDKKTKVVYGSRFTKEFKPKILLCHYIGNLILTFITNLLYNSRITDMETCYKVFTKDVIKNIKLRARRFDFEPEITAKVLKKHYKIYEVPIFYNSRNFEEGKKITWCDGIKAFYYLIKYRFID